MEVVDLYIDDYYIYIYIYIYILYIYKTWIRAANNQRMSDHTRLFNTQYTCSVKYIGFVKKKQKKTEI